MKFIKLVLLTLILLVGSQGIGLCKVVDETGNGQVVAPDEIPNRPMRDDANLKAIQTAFDNSDPRANIKRFPYDPGITYKIRLREFMGCTVVLPDQEKIVGYTLFDKHNFTFTPLSDKNPVLTHIFDLYAKFHGADTNLVVHGESGNIYSFYIRVDSVDSVFMPNLVYYIDDPDTTQAFIKKKEAAAEAEKLAAALDAEEKNEKPKKEDAQGNDYLKSLPTKVAAKDLNFSYIFKGGNEDIKPLRVFDDGYFTFFQFGKDNMNEVKKLPVIYRVVDGYDVLVNTRISGGCLVAESINEKWTLRSGETHYCIWMDN